MPLRPVIAAAPTGLFLYGVCRYLDGRQGFYGPGFFWTLGHVFFVFAFLAFAFLVWALKDGARAKPLALAAAVLALTGIAGFLRVGMIDIATGLLSSDHAAMAPVSLRLNAWPDARLLPYFGVAPFLFQAGLLALLVLKATARALPWWSVAAVVLGFLIIGFDLNLLPLGAVVIGAGFYPLLQSRAVPNP